MVGSSLIDALPPQQSIRILRTSTYMCVLVSKTCHKSVPFCTERHTYAAKVINTQCILHKHHEYERFSTHFVLLG